MPAFNFRMRQLPKAEYQLMKLMIDHFNVDDPCELFTVLLRLGYEVTHFTQTIQGEQWIRRLINEYRSNPDEDRQYEL